MSLPSYPFSPTRHPWPDEVDAASGRSHPLLHDNASTLDRTCYRTTFTGSEFMLRDHVVDGVPLLPAVAGLEMAYGAVLLGVSAAEDVRVSLRNVTWARPVVVDGTQRRVSVTVERDGDALAFALSADDQLHVQGRAVTEGAGDRPTIELDGLRRALDQPPLSGEECYARIADAGVRYGPTFRLITTVWRGTLDGTPTALARLVLPKALRPGMHDYRLHPSLLDAAIHTAVGLRPDDEADARTQVPFALDRLEGYAPLGPTMYACVRDTGGGRLDVELADEQGRVCVALRGLAFRGLADDRETRPRLHALRPVWDVVPNDEPIPPPDGVTVVLGGTGTGPFSVAVPEGASVQQIADLLRPAVRAGLGAVVWHAPADDVRAADIVAAQERGVIAVYRLVKALLALGLGSRPLAVTALTTATQRVRPEDRVRPAHAAVHGLLGSVAREQTLWTVRCVDLHAGVDLPDLGRLPRPSSPGGSLALRDGRWYAQGLLDGPMPEPGVAEVMRPGGVYVVIGGAGGVGELWSRYIVRHHRATVVWLGRRPLDGGVEDALGSLADLAREVGAAAPTYLSVDARDVEGLRAA
ncbi:MAG: polyketide synthase dehydratase domain-containing protein, partial [Phycicoccus sp.]